MRFSLNIPEQKFKSILESIGFVVKFFSQKTTIDPLNCFYAEFPFENMILDFALIKSKLAIEIYGEYWHGLKTVITPRQAEKRIQDAKKKLILSKNKWELIEIPSLSINKITKNRIRKQILNLLVV